MKTKTTIIATLLVMLFFGASIAQNTYEPSPGYEPVLTKSEFWGDSRNDGCNVLVLRDKLPWGLDVTVPILISQGATVTTATSAVFPGLDFTDFCVIVIESAQPSVFYTAYSNNLSKFFDYVISGGVLQVHTALLAPLPNVVAPITLPGGVTIQSNPEGDNIVTTPTHPIVDGVPSPFSGTAASHGYFDNLIAGTLIITEEQSNPRPTTIEYALGAGLVIATTVTYEYTYNVNWDAKDMLPNNLQYSCDDEPVAMPVPLSDWAFYLGILLMISFVVIRFRRVI